MAAGEADDHILGSSHLRQEPQWSSRNGLLSIVLLMIVGVLISGTLYWILRIKEREFIRQQFVHHASDRISNITHELESALSLVRSSSAYMKSSEPDRQSFRAFTRNLFDTDRHIHAISWNIRVPAAEQAEYLREVRRWHPQYTLSEICPDGTMVQVDPLHTENRSRDRVVVKYIEPLAANESALGLDIASEPTRLEALQRARDTGNVAATAAIHLVQETETQYGMLVLAPIYDPETEHASVQQRRDSFRGVVAGVLRIGAVVESAIARLQPVGIDIFLFGASSVSDNQLLHFHPTPLMARSTPPPVDQASLQSQELYECASFRVGGQQWTLCCTPTPQFIAGASTWTPLTALATGLGATFLFAVYLFSFSRLTNQLQHHLQQRKAAERTLNRTQHSIDSSQIPTFWVGRNSKLRYVNPAAAQRLGYQPQELLRMGLEDIVPDWPSDQWDRMWQEMKDVGSSIFESIHRRKDGTTFPVEIMLNYFSYEDDEFFFCQALDITERIEQQARLQEHEQALAHVSRLSTLGEMVAGIAHEINQPLSAISSYAGACSRALGACELDSQLPLVEWTEQIGQQAVRCGNIIRRLRRFAQKNQPERCQVNLNDVVDESIALIKNDVRKRHIQLEWNAADPSPCVRVDRVQLQQVMINLVRNACDAVSQCDPSDRRVMLYSRVCPSHVCLTVQDRGHGIQAEHVNRLFDAFFTTKSDGLGMGLAISRSIVEAHGGRLWAEADSAGGAKFHVELPCTATAADQG